VLSFALGRSALKNAVCALAAATALIPATASADPYLEAAGPTDAAVAVMVVHGGGWGSSGHGYFVATQRTIDRYAQEYRTFNVGYGAGAQSVTDVIAAHDQVRAIVGPLVPICVSGISAGGHLAMMLAEARDVACTISAGGPTDLTVPTNEGLHALALAAFGYGPGNLAAASPRLHTDAFSGPLLMVHATNDLVVPVQQSELMAQALPGAQLVTLPDGPMNFVHRQVDPTALAAFYPRERAFIASATAAWRAARTPPSAPAPAPAAQPTAAPAQKAATPAPKRRTVKRKITRRRAHKRS